MKEGKSTIPLGAAKSLEGAKETLPVIEVLNKVVWINRELETPFNLEEGKPAKIGMFLTPDASEKHRQIEINTGHNRSGLLGRVVFGEKKKEGTKSELFRDIDIKGIGYTNILHAAGKTVVIPVERNEYGSRGIMNLGDAEKDAHIAELLHSLGIRTHRAVAIISLEEIVDANGKKIKIEEAKKLKMLDDSDQPVLEIRAFGLKTRLSDIFNDDNEKRETLLEDARIFVAQELGKNPEEFSKIDYFNWFARVIGNNLRLLKKNGWEHGYLSQGHNITLDGRFVDFDSVASIEPKTANERNTNDYDAAWLVLIHFFNYCIDTDLGSPQRISFLREFRLGYKGDEDEE